jgi:hypothetical protein
VSIEVEASVEETLIGRLMAGDRGVLQEEASYWMDEANWRMMHSRIVEAIPCGDGVLALSTGSQVGN